MQEGTRGRSQQQLSRTASLDAQQRSSLQTKSNFQKFAPPRTKFLFLRHSQAAIDATTNNNADSELCSDGIENNWTLQSKGLMGMGISMTRAKKRPMTRQVSRKSGRPMHSIAAEKASETA